MKNINILVFKWNTVPNQLIPSGNIKATKTKYDSNYINRHYKLIKNKCSEVNYFCVTDDPVGLDKKINIIPLWNEARNFGGCYLRLYLFSKEFTKLLDEKFLLLDVDTTIIRDFSHLYYESKENLIFYRTVNPEKNKSGKFYRFHLNTCLITPGVKSDIWDNFINGDPSETIHLSRKYFTGTDQSWLNYYAKKTNWNPAYWDNRDGLYLMNDIIKLNNKLPTNSLIINWAGPKDPYEAKWRNINWVKENS